MTTESTPRLEMAKAYDPAKVEQRLYRWWMERDLFAPKGDLSRTPFVVIQPPPNVTGELHLGHALTATIQDIMARWHRMQGDPTLWLPGIDHAGIATQVVVERELVKERLTRQQLGREQFLRRVWEWVHTYRSRIGEQHHRLGASLDWSRERFTLDPGPSLAVRTTFANLYRRGLIYRGERMINWCPRCSTALSDLEVEHQEEQGHLWHLRYPLADGSGHVTVATTRPETMLGDTAVAVNPADARYTSLVGKRVRLPLVDRPIPIIADKLVDIAFGTGALKITPGHDPNDFEVGARHALPTINVMDLDGTINDQGGAYAGLDRYEARRRVVQDLEHLGLLDKVEPHTHAVGHCQRCRQAVEPLVSKQWFVRMAPLAAPALEAVRNGAIRIIPEHFAKVYENWMENIRDWCISRQLWWGHRIPVWYCVHCNGAKITLTLTGAQQSSLSLGLSSSEAKEEGAGDGQAKSSPPGVPVEQETDTLAGFLARGLSLADVDAHVHTSDIGLGVTPLVGVEPPKACPVCAGTELFQDPDVLDTWFSSGLWTHSTLGWPNDTQDMRTFYPTSVMETAYEILFFWVARMIMMGIENTGQPPFRTVYLHGLVRDVEGQKMSKSRGNVIDPIGAIDQYGADALRFALTAGNAAGTDSRMREAKLEAGRNFANKLWNASRFVLMSTESASPGPVAGWRSPAPQTLEDRWVLSRLNRVTGEVTRLLEEFQFAEAEQTLYEFIWEELCDWYLEAAKVRLRQGNALHPSPRSDVDTERESRPARDVPPSSLRRRDHEEGSPIPILAHTLEKTLRLLHPFMPFITEEVWQHLRPQLTDATSISNSLMVAPFPTVETSLLDEEAEANFSLISGIVRAVRNARAEFRIEPQRPLEVLIDAAGLRPVIQQSVPLIQALARVQPLHLLGPQDPRPAPLQTITTLVGRVAVFLPIAGLVDVRAERSRLERELAECLANIQRLQGRLADEQFLGKAPAEVVERERARLSSLSERQDKVRELLAALPG